MVPQSTASEKGAPSKSKQAQAGAVKLGLSGERAALVVELNAHLFPVLAHQLKEVIERLDLLNLLTGMHHRLMQLDECQLLRSPARRGIEHFLIDRELSAQELLKALLGIVPEIRINKAQIDIAVDNEMPVVWIVWIDQALDTG